MSSSSERMVAIEWSMRSLIGTSVPPSQAQANLPSQPPKPTSQANLCWWLCIY